MNENIPAKKSTDEDNPVKATNDEKKIIKLDTSLRYKACVKREKKLKEKARHGNNNS